MQSGLQVVMEEFGKKAGPGQSTVSQRDQYMTSMLGGVAQVSPVLSWALPVWAALAGSQVAMHGAQAQQTECRC